MKTYKIKINDEEIVITQDVDGKFILPSIVKTNKTIGTAMKPAHEPILMFRKPLNEKTVADNVLKHGTGGINIDACRIETSETITNHSRGNESAKSKGIYGDSSGQETHQTSGQSLGRFPANIILSKDVDIYKLKEHVTAEELLKLGNWMNENT